MNSRPQQYRYNHNIIVNREGIHSFDLIIHYRYTCTVIQSVQSNTSYINHGQEIYIPPAVEEGFGNMPQGPQPKGYIPINL